MFRVKDGKIIARNLLQSGRLSTGETVSGYHKLPADILEKEAIRDPKDEPAIKG